MKMLTLATVVLLTAIPAMAQDIPSTPIPLDKTDPLTALGGPGEAPPATAPANRKPAPTPAPRQVAQAEQAPPAPVPAAPPQMGQAVQVEDGGEWDPCTVTQVFKGAYEVMCNYSKKIVRDTKVRRIGGKPVATSAAVPVSGPPYPRGALVEASPLSLPDRWQLCIVAADQVSQSGSYRLTCAGSAMNVAPQWIRIPADE